MESLSDARAAGPAVRSDELLVQSTFESRRAKVKVWYRNLVRPPNG